ncbi:MAG: OmpA family protein [Flavobacteriaceae bacterium]|nr:OmpA family protein [Flavobacteriaceae bacterium]
MKKFLLYTLLFISFLNAKAQEQFAVYFDSNKSNVTKAENKKLQDWIIANKDVKIVAINGYTDEVGSTQFNDTLAQKRVGFILSQVKDKIKIREDFKTRSYGENFLQSQDKSKNRKAVIFYILSKDLVREDEILGIKKAIVLEPKKEINYPEQLSFQNPDGSKIEYKLDKVFMKKIGESKAGEKLKIENLNFVINTFIVVNESRGKMYELLIVLQKNPKLKIEIQGHLCCQPIDRLNLSTQRAQSIYKFLIANGIDKSRLSYKGFGSSMPLFPLPEKDENERSANRRVEVLIIENE